MQLFNQRAAVEMRGLEAPEPTVCKINLVSAQPLLLATWLPKLTIHSITIKR